MQRSGNQYRRADLPGFAELLRAELTKFRTVRAWVSGLLAAVVAFVLLAYLSAWASRGAGPALATGPDGRAVSDSYMFVRRPLTGDGSITGRVTTLSGRHSSPTLPGSRGAQPPLGLAPWAKAGLIVEPDTHQGTSYAAVMVTGSHGVRMQFNYTHDRPGLAGFVGPSSPQWLRLTRVGYDSPDGAHWTRLGGERSTGLPRTVQIG
jgi:hypothetical protein